VAVLRRDAKIEMLRHVPLLSRCSRRDLRDVASLAEERNLEPGVELTREGDPGREFFILIDGRVSVRRRKRKIAEIGGGGFFGEIALLTEAPRNATVETIAPTRVLVLRSHQFKGLLEKNAAMAVRIMQALAERVPPAATN
jgi:CRP-like cAMP-binding protein